LVVKQQTIQKEESDIQMLAKRVKRRLHKDWDIVIAITGEEGSGKSSLAIQLGRLIDKDFDLEKNELFSPTTKELKKKMIGLPKFAVIIVDEAIKTMYKLNWSSRLSIFMNQLYALARKENKATILCMPRFRDFNEYFRNHRIKVWIHILERGRAVMFAKDWSPFCKDPWWCDENQKLIEKGTGRQKVISIDFNKKVKFLERTKNFVMEFEFEDLEEETRIKYKELVNKYKYKDMNVDQLGEREKLNRDRLTTTLKVLKGQGLTYAQIQKLTGIPWETTRHLLTRQKPK
jgi:adenylate kinase family enzyme